MVCTCTRIFFYSHCVLLLFKKDNFQYLWKLLRMWSNVISLTDRPDMNVAVYPGRKAATTHTIIYTFITLAFFSRISQLSNRFFSSRRPKAKSALIYKIKIIKGCRGPNLPTLGFSCYFAYFNILIHMHYLSLDTKVL